MDDQKLRDKLASEYCAHDINRDRSSFRLGWDAARANPQPLKDAINMLNAIEELTKECEQLRAELSRQEKLALDEFSRWETAQKERDQLKAENTELKARNWVLQDKSLRTYDGLTTERDELRAAAEKLAEALEFYASNWRSDVYVGPTKDLISDSGQKANNALAEYRAKYEKKEE